MYKKSPDWGIFIIYKKTPSLPAVFPNAPKGRKGEKEMGILKSVSRVQGPEERECRRESESPGPTGTFVSGHQVLSL